MPDAATSKKEVKKVMLTGWIVFNRHGLARLVKQKEPKLDTGERACYLQIVVPETLFVTPQLKAKVEFEGTPQLTHVAETAADIEKLLGQNGFCLTVEAVEPKD